ncbi:unnamed protein product [Adineta steineri]|uniref:MULE transposase domain-containing protein n=1 Tax=Adineta steineri TaxID=433720 RepID=A0A814XC14_9BILA|nr:unnamed protein product [Adineta steineri]CAF1213714.1 unnamed protein product [Adineta steineri]
MMRNLNLLSSLQPSSPSVYHETDDTFSYQASYPSYQTGHQMQSSAYCTTIPTLLPNQYYNTTSPIYPHTISTTSSSLSQFATNNSSSSFCTTSDSSPVLHHTKTSQSTISFTTHTSSSPCYTTANLLQTNHTATTSSLASLFIRQELEPKCESLQTQPNHQNHLPTCTSANHQNSSTTQRDDAHLTIQLSSSHSLTHSTRPQSPLQQSPLQQSPLQQSLQQSPSQHLPSQLTIEHLHVHSPTSTATTSLVLISSMQQQQKLLNQSSDIQSTTIYQYDPLLQGQTIQLLDTTKPYEIGDTIKVGGRILQSDPTSIKYWSDNDLTITETATGESQLYRIRQANLPKSPSDLNFVLHPGFKSTDKGDRFLIYDSSDVQPPYTLAPTAVGRLIIYSSELQLGILAKSYRVGSDGTFETSAGMVQQNYILMAELEEMYSVPTVFCLCEKKNYETYQLILQVLKISITNLQLDFTPGYWISDYEDALLPGTEVQGCTFHYSQALYRNIQKKGLQEAYQEVEIVRQVLRQIMALGFLPAHEIKKAYEDIIKPQLKDVPAQPVSLRQNLREFFRYFEKEWLKKVHEFCVFDQSVRTNNALEGINFF